MRPALRLILLSFVLLSLACSLSPNVLSSTLEAIEAGEQPATETRAPIAASETPMESGQATEAAPAASTTPAEVHCVSPAPQEALSESVFENYPNLILAYLNAGGTAEALNAELESLAISTSPVHATAADLTGDGQLEVIASIINPESQQINPAGALLVYNCLEGAYLLSHIELPAEPVGAPAIVHVQDLNQDGLEELIYSSSVCGANTCFEEAQILSWNGEFYEQKLEGVTNDLPYPNIQITDYDQDGVFSLEVTSSGFGSVGAGPQRPISRVWAYDPEAGVWRPGEDAPGPSEFRIHVLHDADEAARRGEYEVALLLYDQVINSNVLTDWIDLESERRNLTAYARFKQVVIYALMGNPGAAERSLEGMQNSYFHDQPQFVYLEMAEAFLDALEDGGEQDAACLAAQVIAAQNADAALASLGSAAFGYANRDYSPIDVCP